MQQLRRQDPSSTRGIAPKLWKERSGRRLAPELPSTAGEQAGGQGGAIEIPLFLRMLISFSPAQGGRAGYSWTEHSQTRRAAYLRARYGVHRVVSPPSLFLGRPAASALPTSFILPLLRWRCYWHFSPGRVVRWLLTGEPAGRERVGHHKSRLRIDTSVPTMVESRTG
ncbi:hypothetical protein B0H19DRAFT_1083530 [Mycena capillaripes]|nr:hypothetical protein B0H19DRAFT_1083530 [Mycena capillaripes]